jgi:hypothetical protein
MEILGREECVRRIGEAIRVLLAQEAGEKAATKPRIELIRIQSFGTESAS